MFEKIQRDNNYINDIKQFIDKEYGIKIVSLNEAKRGYNAETWKVDSIECSYFVKVVYSLEHKNTYMRSFPVIDYLNNNGITFISNIIKTKKGELYSIFDNAIVGIFKWIDGVNIENEETIIHQYEMLAKIYKISPIGLTISYEDFGTSAADLFFSQFIKLKKTSTNNQLLTFYESKSNTLNENRKKLELFSRMVKEDKNNFYITHGDAGGNVLVMNSNYYIVDWDEIMCSPPERDIWFCMNKGDKLKLFNEALKEEGIQYTINFNRMAYYCYHMFFYYLTKYMNTYFELGSNTNDLVNEIISYFSGWISDVIETADKIEI